MFLSFNGYLNHDVTQGQLILPRPGNDSLYDVLVIDVSPDSSINNLRKPKMLHMVVDIFANGGTGAMVSNEVAFGYNLTERLTGTPHGDGTDYWVLAHEWKSDKFLAYRLAANGLDTVPVVSHAGALHSAQYGTCLTNRNRQGEMKFNYVGDVLAITSHNGVCGSDTLQPGIVQLFDFDDATGSVTYWMTLPDHSQGYGIEFSQDGSKLYVPGIDPLALELYVDQYDLLAGDTTAVVSSRTRVYATPYDGQPTSQIPTAMELAPNGKIYVSRSGSSMDVIQAPNLADLDCGYEENSIIFPNPQTYVGHTNQIKRYHDSEYKRDDVGFGAEQHQSQFAVWPNPASSSIRLRMPAKIASPRVRIHDNTGRLLREVSGQVALSGTMDLSSLASGMYTVSLLDGSAVVGQARLVVQ